MSATQPLRMPAAVARQKGVSELTAAAQERTLILTEHGNPTAVVMSSSEYDAQQRRLAELEQHILGAAAELVADRSTVHTAAAARERLLAAD